VVFGRWLQQHQRWKGRIIAKIIRPFQRSADDGEARRRGKKHLWAYRRFSNYKFPGDRKCKVLVLRDRRQPRPTIKIPPGAVAVKITVNGAAAGTSVLLPLLEKTSTAVLTAGAEWPYLP